MNFGVGDVKDNFVTFLPDVIAPEIICDGKGNEYITNIWYVNKYGICIAQLYWMAEN